MFCVLFIIYDIKNKNDFIKFLTYFDNTNFLKNELILIIIYNGNLLLIM